MQSFIDLGFWWVSTILFIGVVIRYFLLSLIFESIFSSEKSVNSPRFVYRVLPKTRQKSVEIIWSLITSLIFAFLGTGILFLWVNGHTAIYSQLSDYPIWMIPVGIIGVLVLHESMYYWLHRWMHHPGVFKWIHKVHHQSLATSSWTAFSFHPIEGFIQLAMLVIIVMIVPLHYIVLLSLLLFMTLSATINHLGVDIYPKNGVFRKWVIGARHHALHHEEFDHNYGLYFTFWDRWMNTEREEKVK